MEISFKHFCKEQNLPHHYQEESNLSSIVTWCQKNISQDAQFSGDSSIQYQEYFTFVENYLDNFITHVPDDLARKRFCDGDENAIHYAAHQGYNRFIEMQSNISNIINENDANGMTSLHKAATQGNFFTVKALLSKGADVHKTDKRGQLPIHSAVFLPILHDDILIGSKEKIVRELLPLTPEADTHVDIDGNCLLHLLATHRFENIMNEVLNTFPKLAFVKNNASLYPIHTAILNNQLKTTELVLSIDKVAELGDVQNRLPLHYAARYGTAKMVKTCCDYTSDINSKDSQGRTAIIWAVYSGNIEALSTLIQNGADTKLTDPQDFSILDIAKNEHNDSLVKWINNNLGME